MQGGHEPRKFVARAEICTEIYCSKILSHHNQFSSCITVFTFSRFFTRAYVRALTWRFSTSLIIPSSAISTGKYSKEKAIFLVGSVLHDVCEPPTFITLFAIVACIKPLARWFLPVTARKSLSRCKRDYLRHEAFSKLASAKGIERAFPSAEQKLCRIHLLTKGWTNWNEDECVRWFYLIKSLTLSRWTCAKRIVKLLSRKIMHYWCKSFAREKSWFCCGRWKVRTRLNKSCVEPGKRSDPALNLSRQLTKPRAIAAAALCVCRLILYLHSRFALHAAVEQQRGALILDWLCAKIVL